MRLIALLLSAASLAAAASAPQEGLTLERAQSIASRAAACGKKNGWKLSIAIVNSEGNLAYFQRGDGSYVGSIQASIDKARSANNFQRPTKALAESVRSGNVGAVTVKDVIALEGGVPITLSGGHAGAIGISGAKAIEDEQCALAALEQTP